MSLNMNFKQQRVGDMGDAKCFQHFANTQTLSEMYREGGKTGALYNIVQIPETVNNTMNLNGSTTNNVKYEVGFNDEDSIT